LKIFTASPLPLGKDSWGRDITVIFRGFQSLGFDSACVRLISKDGTHFPGIHQVTPQQMASTAWWLNHSCDWVILNSWGNPKFTPVAKAIKDSGSKLVIRMDSDGYNSPRNGFFRYLRISQCIFSETQSPICAASKAFLKTLLYAFPQVYDKKMLAHISIADIIGIESLGAKIKFNSLLRRYHRSDLIEKLHVIHHPVVPEIDRIGLRPPLSRANRIVCVGRWNSPQKDAKLLVKTLAGTLARNPLWGVEIFGSGDSIINSLLQTIPKSISNRILFKGVCPHSDILEAFQQSKISLFSSVYESGPIAAEEALCLGCTIVGPADLPSMLDLCKDDWGTLSPTRSVQSMQSALLNEMHLWDLGQRDPFDSSKRARFAYSAVNVCSNILNIANQV
jgi:glycosyltransferase involved in cell wall biosynthesis